MQVVDAHLSLRERKHAVAEVAPEHDLLEKQGVRTEGLPPERRERLVGHRRGVDLELARRLRRPLEEGDPEAARRRGDLHLALARPEEAGPRGQDRRQRKADVRDHLPRRRLDQEGRVIVLAADAAEQPPRPEPERRQKLLERGDPREAGAARSAREVLCPEDVRGPRLLRRIRDAARGARSSTRSRRAPSR